jgi:5,10-methylenetetrahydromethanopterin reductase
MTATTAPTASISVLELGPVVDDFGIFLIPGRTTDPAIALSQGEEAERLGFRRAWLSERYDLKESGALLGGVAARTSRLEVGTGVLASGSRHPLIAAAMTATMHAMYDGRFVLGLGRSSGEYLAKQSIPIHNLKAFADYIEIVRALLRGETVQYDGPAGTFEELTCIDTPANGVPPIWYVTEGGPKACRVAAEHADGIMLKPFMTIKAAAQSVEWIRRAREELGKDPGIRICLPLITACELDDTQTALISAARFITYIAGMPGYAANYVRSNGWDPAVMQSVQEHRQFANMDRPNADQTFYRHQLLEPAKLIPDEWMQASCAIGSVEDCVARLQQYKDVGIDEFALYGSTPAQNANLIKAWREHRAAQERDRSPAVGVRTG